MTNDQLITQLVGRVSALEYLLAQTLALVVRDRADPQGSLADLRAYFERASANIDAQLPAARPAAEEAANRIYDIVREAL